MEQLQIHSKSYLVRWVDVKGDHTISWSIQPHKKSINFGIFKHPGSHIAPTPRVDSSTFEAPPTPGIKPQEFSDGSKDSPSYAVEKLKSIGLKLVQWHGTCEANQVTTGTYDVSKSEGGMYALVFDNTFAKQFSKTATFVLLTYPTNAAPQSNHQVRGVQGTSKSRPKLSPEPSQQRSSDSLPTNATFRDAAANDAMHGSKDLAESSASSNFFTGTLQKRRRKRHQGYARRYFSLDFSSSTLSYYHNRHTVAMRGSIPLSIAAIGTNEGRREISIDSGAEVWHLKAPNKKEFAKWKEALEVASMSGSTDTVGSGTGFESVRRTATIRHVDPLEEREWARVEELVAKVAKSRDMARDLAKDTDPKYLPPIPSMASMGQRHSASSTEASPIDYTGAEDYFGSVERRSFWKRKPGKQKHEGQKRSTSAQSNPSTLAHRNASIEKDHGFMPKLQDLADPNLHEHCMSLLQTLDSAVAELSTLIAESRHRRHPAPTTASSRMSLDSVGTQEFFDAEGGDSQLLTIHQSDDEGGHTEPELEQWDSSPSDIEDGDDDLERSSVLDKDAQALFPSKPKGTILHAMKPVQYRTTIPPPKIPPPSLIGFLRKNVGKDLSTISMPVTANEPLSLLQKVAEMMEYSALLDAACSPNMSATDRLLHVTAFAISNLSNGRVKERAIRKPFNPMLGETFELLRPDRGFRFVAEKVSHRPVRMACQADSTNGWSLAHSPLPTQKFWGKSAEILMEGRVRLSLHATGERFSWAPPTCFLRNIIAGEKYVEPTGTMAVHCDSSGAHALVTFKSGGMFSGRSEDVVVQAFDAHGGEMSAGLVGRWTQGLTPTDGGGTGATPRPGAAPVWTAGALVPDAPRTYGFTTFAASLNEWRAADEEVLPPSDSRRRPDQRAAEEGRIDDAEGLKAALEEAQRRRRREIEESGETWVPAWFGKVEGVEGGEEVWKLKGGKEGYWDCRTRGDWKRGKKVFEM